MRFQTPLVPARLRRRYKRFLADAVLEGSGREVTAHCPNPGAMLGLAAPGARIWLEPNDDPKRKLGFGWRIEELPGGGLAGIDTGVPNRLVSEALAAGSLEGFDGYETVRAEVPYARRSRVDFLLRGGGRRDCYLEIKNAHLRRGGRLAEFPDCVTARGARHLEDLAEMARRGFRAAMLYVVQRTDCDALALARDIDPAYGRAFDAARDAGVEVHVREARITTEAITLGHALPFAG